MKKAFFTLAILMIGCAFYYRFFLTLSFAIGLSWGILNFYFIQELLFELLLVNPKKIGKIILLSFIKFPLLYGAGFVLLYYLNNFVGFLLGFSATLLLLICRKVVARKKTINS